ncbi:hypothetical protein SADUNF_Sadunf05G0071500 [Salix dunnii]|uniref:Major facilitator superfamily (MFS) profile domain-containing protein n=1 Tax=Salix dunnii TaxID=1413687 RepID=A0A835K4Y5_9ROSI|nr:hypothetical protein SADUNF_Sadunf05G0071500 [Salix dunnii]
MRGSVLVALAATVGNLLQGWDNSSIAGSIPYIKEELNLQSQPAVEGLIVAMSIIGGTTITTFAGTVSDSFGRRPMLIMSSILYFLSSIIIQWAPNVYVLLLARLLDGFGVGLAVTLIPLYISETAPSEMRGQLNTLPQFMGSGGMFLSYCMVFFMSMMDSPSWRLMLGTLSIPAVIYLSLTLFFLPESPRWLVSKGKMIEAKRILQRLRGREDVSGELALLLEGLGVGTETTIEEYIIGPANEITGETDAKEHVKLYGPEEGVSWIAKPVTAGFSSLGMLSRNGSLANQSVPLMDPLVTLFGSVHENMHTTGSTRSLLFPNSASMVSVGENQGTNEHLDEEGDKDGEESYPEAYRTDSDDNLRSPLLSHHHSSMEKGTSHSSMFSSRRNSSLVNSGEEGVMGIGGGWQLAYKWSEKIGKDGRKEGGLQRIYLHQEGTIGSQQHSVTSSAGFGIPEDEFVQAAALVSQPAVCSKDILGQASEGLAAIHPSEIAAKGSGCDALFEPGVKRALIVGVGLQILQQVAGINGVLYYTPQILEQAGVVVLLSSLGLSSASASFLMSILTTFLMLPCIFLAMRLMDVSGRRSILLYTIPILVVSLVVFILGSVFNMDSSLKAVISTGSVMIYLSCFVMGFGVIPNILCAEIFPTRVRGICITICSLTYWIGNITITYSLPVMLNYLGLSGVFTIYAIGCAVSWIFVFLKVPETKGMPLEVITEFFAVGSKND